MTSAGSGPDIAVLAAEVLARLERRGWTIGMAESLTGGLVASALIAIPGASLSVRGGVIAYATDLKQSLLRVDTDLLASAGAVDPAVAWQMAEGARSLLKTDVGVATTGVAGPDPQDGKPVGTVHIAVVTPDGTGISSLEIPGSRDQIRFESVVRALTLCLEEL